MASPAGPPSYRVLELFEFSPFTLDPDRVYTVKVLAPAGFSEEYVQKVFKSQESDAGQVVRAEQNLVVPGPGKNAFADLWHVRLQWKGPSREFSQLSALKTMNQAPIAGMSPARQLAATLFSAAVQPQGSKERAKFFLVGVV